MSKAFIETSVFIRFLTKDHQQKYLDCVKFLELVSKGKIRPYTSNVVVMEIIFILMRQYKFDKKNILPAINKLLQIRNLTLVEKTNTKNALKIFQKYSIKYGDALIAAQVPKDIILISYDKDFKKIKRITSNTPGELIKNITKYKS